MKKSACEFLDKIADPSRKSKRVHLLHGNGDRSLTDAVWINGALQTTALRKRPKCIKDQIGGLGYTAVRNKATDIAKEFAENLSKIKPEDYTTTLYIYCDKLENSAKKANLHWNFGRSQKFFNILTKYWLCVFYAQPDRLSEVDLALVKKFKDAFHAPVDSITIKHLIKKLKSPNLKEIYWGWNMTKDVYEGIQKSISNLAKNENLSPLEYETSKIWGPQDPKTRLANK